MVNDRRRRVRSTDVHRRTHSLPAPRSRSSAVDTS